MDRLSPKVLFQSGHLAQDLGKKSLRGGLSAVLSQGLQFILRVSGTAILARLLTPEDYGVFGMAMVVISFAAMIKLTGLPAVIVQTEHITSEQFSNLFWLNLLISTIVALCVALGAPIVALFYGRAELTPVIVFLSACIIFHGITAPYEALLRRHMRFDLLAVTQTLSQLVRLAMMIIFALAGYRYWALAVGWFSAFLSSILILFYYCPWLPGAVTKGAGIRGMLKFSGDLTGFHFINYFTNNADNILIGKYVGADPLGIYSRSHQLSIIALNQIQTPISQVAVPALSALRGQPDRYARYYSRILDIMATFTMPLAAYCALEADFIVRFMLGDKWLGAVPVLRILSIAELVQSVAGTRGLVMLSWGLSKKYLYWGMVNAAAYVAGFLCGLPYGINGVAAAYAIVTYLLLLPSLYYCFAGTPATVKMFFTTLLPPVLSSGAAAAGLLLCRSFTSDSIASHVAAGMLFLSIYVYLTLRGPSFKETAGLLLDALNLRQPAKEARKVAAQAGSLIALRLRGVRIPNKKILITGCGRSGTNYVATLLTKMGLPIGHEEMSWFGTAAWELAVDAETPLRNSALRRRDHKFGVILHQVRHPLAVISSMRTAGTASWEYIQQHIPVGDKDPLLLKCMKYWYYWNLESEKISCWRYKIEDLPDIFETFCDKIGHPELLLRKDLLHNIRRDINSRKGKYGELGEVAWSTIENVDKELCHNIVAMAERYGYRK